MDLHIYRDLYRHKRANEEDIVPQMVVPFGKAQYEKYELMRIQQL